jgi:peptidoglycan/xylan/chitin deacetylase (PgdA/CDA1 family)
VLPGRARQARRDVDALRTNEAEERANIKRCTSLLEECSGRRVKGWLSPRATPSANTPRLLAEAGYTWYGDTLADDLPYVETFGARKIVAIPLSTDVNDMPSMKYGHPPRHMLETFEDVLERVVTYEQAPVIIDATVHLITTAGAKADHRMSDLLPVDFGPSDLGLAEPAR